MARAKTRLHPIVAKFIAEGRPVFELFEDRPDSKDPVVMALFEMQEAYKDRRLIEAGLQAASKAVSALSDPNLAILFLGLWADLDGRAHRVAELGVLTAKMRSLLTDSTPPEVRAISLNNERVCLMLSGNWKRAEELSREIRETIPADSPRFAAEALNLAFTLALLGKEAEVDMAIVGVATKDRERLKLAEIRTINALETGQLGWAAKLVSDWHSIAETSGKGVTGNLVLCEQILNAMQGRTVAESEQEVPAWMLVARRLWARQTEEALDSARRQAVNRQDSEPGLGSWSLIRAELAAGHGDAARRLLEERRRRGSVHYLDDFFLARVELLAGRREKAARHFAAVRGACERYRALGRLDFELRLSCELSPLDLVALAGGGEAPAEPVPVPAPSVPAPVPPPVPVGLGRLVGGSAAMVGIRSMIARLAPLNVPVLVTGETGTGKELVARAIHEEGPRREEPFVAVNCGAVAESLIESELFGHEKGAFTGAQRAHRGLFEEAGSGTVLLDEIGEIPARLQVALLRVLESGEIRPVGSATPRKTRCRIVAATNAPLDRLETEGLFRKDLLYRLRRMEVQIPPLRERRDDILPLAAHFLAEGRADGRQPEISAQLQSVLAAYAWPGNVRELKNEMERLRLLNSEGLGYDVGLLEPGRLAWTGRRTDATVPAAAAPPTAENTGDVSVRDLLAGGKTPLRRLDRLRDLFRGHGELTRSEVARILGISAETATRDLKALRAEGFLDRVEPTASPRTHYFRLKAPPDTSPNSRAK